MADNAQVTVVGNLTADPELRFTNNGTAVVSFTIASTPRIQNRATGEWEDGNALFLNCSAWNALADNIAQTLTKGVNVIARGRLQQRSYDAKDGTKRTVFDLNVDDIGPNLVRATAQISKTTRGQNGGNFGGNSSAPAANRQAAAPANNSSPASDPWSDSSADISDPTDLPF